MTNWKDTPIEDRLKVYALITETIKAYESRLKDVANSRSDYRIEQLGAYLHNLIDDAFNAYVKQLNESIALENTELQLLINSMKGK